MWIPKTLKREFTDHPIRLADVGARGGWQRHWQAVSRYATFIGFEPEPTEYARLVESASQNEIFSPYALYSREEQIGLYITGNPNNTSIYPPNRDLIGALAPADDSMRVISTVSCEATTLDSALEELGCKELDFIKLDTQGSELDILEGSERVLATGTFGVECEVEFLPLYIGQPLFSDVHQYLVNKSFQFIDFVNIQTTADFAFRKRGMRGYANTGALIRAWLGKLASPKGAWRGGKQLLSADAVYFRTPNSYLRGPAQEARRRAQVGTLIACILGYYEYAWSVQHAASELEAIDDSLQVDLQHMIVRSSRSLRPILNDIRRGARRIMERARHPGR